MSRISAVWMLLGFVSLGAASSCLYDSGQRCDAGQTYNATAGLCVCGPNTVAGDHGCVACGENEVASNGVCSCALGYSGSPCVKAPEALGIVCTADADCNDATYSTCHIGAAPAAGYCTNPCTSDTDCSANYACNTTAMPSFCQRPPLGVNMGCASDMDCAGTEATFCEYIQTKKCIARCSISANDCFPGQVCCDLTGPSFGIYKEQICMVGPCK